ncbi:MAG: beta-galactosidase, partial [Candidatus Lokiarchaeota archaeon]|nr:beta-galactosidase [Candidatus Lokiarchaeota archaeon]
MVEVNGIEVSKYDFKVGKRSMILLAGEFHYFRVPPEAWNDRLGQLKEMGANAVSTYVPWNWHEEYKGKFDFASPEKDINAFLELCELYRFKILIRPGPWICSEWINGAIPGWLLEEHPEILCTNDEGKVPPWNSLKSPPISYLHPAYLDHVKRWYAAVAPIIKAHEHPRGGIILVQPDNELSFGFNKGLWEVDYNKPSVAFYREFLQRKHETIERANAAHGTRFASFDKVEPPRRKDAKGGGKQFLVRCNDWMEAKEGIIQEFTARCIKMLRELGVKSPMYVNAPSLEAPANVMLQHVAERDPEDGSGLVLAGDDYYPRTLEAPFLQDFKISLSAEMLDAQLPHLPFSPEFQGGHYQEPSGVNDAQMLPRLALAHGIKAFSFYMLVGGRNPPMPASLVKRYKHPFDHYGTYANVVGPGNVIDPTGRTYDFGAAVGERGQKSDRFLIYQRFFALCANNAPELLSMSKVHDDIAYFHYQPYERIKLQTAPLGFVLNYNNMTSIQVGSPFFQFLSCLNHLHYQPKLVELTLAAPEELARYRVAFGFFASYMDGTTLNKLVDFVKGGGTLVMLFEIPSTDMTMAPFDAMAGLVPTTVEAKVTDEPVTALNHVIDSADFALAFKDIPNGSEVIATLPGGRICAYAAEVGKGKVVQLGFAPPPEKEGRAFVQALLDDLKVPPPRSSTSVPGVLAVQQEAPGGERLVAVCNLWKRDEAVDVVLEDAARKASARVEIKGIKVIARTCLFWHVNKVLADGVAIALATSEITSTKKEGSQLVVNGFNFKNATGQLWISTDSKPKKCSHKFTYGGDKV